MWWPSGHKEAKRDHWSGQRVPQARLIVPAFVPGVGSPPLSIIINTSLFTLEFELPNVLISIVISELGCTIFLKS